jgi:hypothetical protein
MRMLHLVMTHGLGVMWASGLGERVDAIIYGRATLAKRTTLDSGLGRHFTMLPSRGLRPAQLVPLSSRQSTVLRSSVSRKVRIIQSVALLARPISALTSACRTSES